MFLVVFRNRKRAAIDRAAYDKQAAHMEAMARAQPGFASFKGFTAEDGEVAAISEWQGEAAARAWGRNPAHRAAPQDGRSRWCVHYTLIEAAEPRIHSFIASEP
ncbi:antibiotic biosynthesis monooxygenase [Erythrobacter arachoides]|uniref:Antibiotic biosynthesis monooxygenase n=1 Tax=Aurantiacibacter arachoides TaxID=1850444 RepID=A0A844ZUW3_9SPHN|nr:antibiotic biosynthesis monooxygenase [Aurantiacibacter arachoides]MXO92111.1 antibiotic biosynthesis monooxygenase [Aurantiacibacter arachoides]GGD59630.1 hypothetical protein GCM10011411_19780 [Aurantiacibacter arachoides]